MGVRSLQNGFGSPRGILQNVLQIGRLLGLIGALMGGCAAGVDPLPSDEPGALPGCTHYVDSASTSESWTAASEIATPTRPEVAMANAQAGDTVCFRTGTYDPGTVYGVFDTPAYNPSNSGTAAQPITFRSYPGESVTILEALGPDHPSGTQPSIGAERASYIVWAGFTLRRNRHNGIEASSIVRFELAEHVTLRDCDIAGVAPQQDGHNGVLIMVANSTDVKIHHNRLHDMVGAPGVSAVNTGAMWIFGDEQIQVHHNDIFNVTHGVQFKANPNWLFVYNNYFYDCETAAIQGGAGVDGARDYFIYRNVIRNCPTGLFSPDPGGVTHRVIFFNNTLVNDGPATLAFLAKPGSLTHRDPEVFNNLLVSGAAGSLFVSFEAAPARPRYVDHNLYFGSGSWRYDGSSYETLAGWRGASGFDLSSLDTDPLLLNSTGTAASDFALRGASPARSAGIDRQDLDGDGDVKEAIAIGAFVTGTESIGASL